MYYGAAGHGRGLVDGMSSFGVKSPLQKEILTKDFFWTSSSELASFFQEKGMHTDHQVYCEITKNELANHQAPNPVELKGYTKQHVIQMAGWPVTPENPEKP